MIGEVLLFLSGANREVLEQCPSERAKFIGVGGAVLTTAVLAAVAATLTLSSFLGLSLPIALVVGLFWGTAILNLDRWLVASTKRQDGVLANLLVALPRILLAFVIGLVIAEPIVLKVFDSEIGVEALRMQQEEIAAQREQQERDYARLDDLREQAGTLEAELGQVSNSEVLTNDAKYKELTTELDQLRARLRDAEQAVICEKEGKCGSGKVGVGPAYDEKVRLRDDLRRQVAAKEQQRTQVEVELLGRQQGAKDSVRPQKEKELDEVRAEIARLESERQEKDRQFTEERSSSIGLLDRMGALSSLAERNGAAQAAHWVLRFFILALDSLPVLVKLFMSLGKPSLYDRSLEQYEQAVVVAGGVFYEHQSEARTIGARLVVDEAKIRHDLELAVVQDLTKEIVDAQKEVARAYVEEWKKTAVHTGEQQLKRMRVATGANGNGSGTQHPGQVRRNPNFQI